MLSQPDDTFCSPGNAANCTIRSDLTCDWKGNAPTACHQSLKELRYDDDMRPRTWFRCLSVT